MLVLFAKKDKRVFFDIEGKRIAVKLDEVRGSGARLVIDAPPECKVTREKLEA